MTTFIKSYSSISDDFLKNIKQDYLTNIKPKINDAGGSIILLHFSPLDVELSKPAKTKKLKNKESKNKVAEFIDFFRPNQVIFLDTLLIMRNNDTDALRKLFNTENFVENLISTPQGFQIFKHIVITSSDMLNFAINDKKFQTILNQLENQDAPFFPLGKNVIATMIELGTWNKSANTYTNQFEIYSAVHSKFGAIDAVRLTKYLDSISFPADKRESLFYLHGVRNVKSLDPSSVIKMLSDTNFVNEMFKTPAGINKFTDLITSSDQVCQLVLKNKSLMELFNKNCNISKQVFTNSCAAHSILLSLKEAGQISEQECTPSKELEIYSKLWSSPGLPADPKRILDFFLSTNKSIIGIELKGQSENVAKDAKLNNELNSFKELFKHRFLSLEAEGLSMKSLLPGVMVLLVTHQGRHIMLGRKSNDNQFIVTDPDNGKSKQYTSLEDFQNGANFSGVAFIVDSTPKKLAGAKNEASFFKSSNVDKKESSPANDSQAIHSTELKKG